MIRTIPIVIFILLMTNFLVTEFRRTGGMSGRNVLNASIGLLGWFIIVNTLLLVWILEGESRAIILNPFRLIPMLVTIVMMLVFTRRRMVLLGVLAAIVVNTIEQLLFVPPSQIMDQRSGRISALLPFYQYFFLPGL
jgi:hypothetical protein